MGGWVGWVEEKEAELLWTLQVGGRMGVERKTLLVGRWVGGSGKEDLGG